MPSLLRHFPFLRAVALYACTAFGGPQGHLGMMLKTFVHRRRDVTEEELLELNAFCQMLPGPASTQTVMLIALKRGGVLLALATLGIWLLPAFVLMSACSFLLVYFGHAIPQHLFDYVRPMSVGFVFYAALLMMRTAVRHPATWAIMLVALLAVVFIRSPWVFPLVLVAAGFASNVSSRRIPKTTAKPKPVRWTSLWLFVVVFVLAGILSELARTGRLGSHGRIFNLFENFYRFGSIVFGGGQALLPMLLYQFVARPTRVGQAPWVQAGDLMTGYGLVQATPGPVFSVCAFTGGLAMQQYGPGWQLAGCLVAMVGVFLPGTLILLFLYPVYQHLKQHVIIYRALEGVHAAVVGMIWASGIVLLLTLAGPDSPTAWPEELVAIGITLAVLLFTKLPAPLLVAGMMVAGLLKGYFQG